MGSPKSLGTSKKSTKNFSRTSKIPPCGIDPQSTWKLLCQVCSKVIFLSNIQNIPKNQSLWGGGDMLPAPRGGVGFLHRWTITGGRGWPAGTLAPRSGRPDGATTPQAPLCGERVCSRHRICEPKPSEHRISGFENGPIRDLRGNQKEPGPNTQGGDRSRGPSNPGGSPAPLELKEELQNGNLRREGKKERQSKKRFKGICCS